MVAGDVQPNTSLLSAVYVYNTNQTILIMLRQSMVISGSLALVDRGVLKHDEAVIHYR